MSKTIYIGGRLESKEKGNVVTGANAILDDTKGKKQNVINKETDDELLRLEQSKQDNLNFDNAPTEDSTNPVTSGGVYTAEKALSDAIEAILLLIPSAATELNKLVDTNTMNSSISTATATFRGTYNAVSDLGLTYQATHAQIEAALDALGLTADNNDFAFVQIPVSDQSQDIAKTERFKFNGTNWLYEYDLNTSGFTASQWSAINSGITAALVTKLTDLPTAASLQLALNAKQDNLTFDNEPTALSQNPVTSGGIYTAIQAVVTALGGRLDTLEGLIPSEASSSNKLTDKAYVDGLIQAITELIPAEADTTNQLADKAYVLAQILAATPAFKGQFVTLAELQAVASPKAGDLGIVRTKDSDGMDVFTIYQYLSNAWNVFFSLSYHPQTKPATTGTTGDYPYNGMGRVELAMNMVNTGTELEPVMVNQLTQDMFYKGAVGSRVPNTNTIFVIRYDYVLAENITIPDNCVMEFEGGSISGAYTLTGANTEVVVKGNYNPFSATLAGTFSQINPADKPYTSGNGMGIVYLKKGVSLASQLTQTNTIYVVQFDFTLTADTTIPSGCVLDFQGGTISGAYELQGNNTGIKAAMVKIFGTDITLTGSWNVSESYPEWFGAKGDGTTDDTAAIQKVINSFDRIYFSRKVYLCSTYASGSCITISSSKTLIGNDFQDYDFDSNIGCLKFTNISTNRAILIDANNVKFQDISIVCGDVNRGGTGIEHVRVSDGGIRKGLTLEHVLIKGFNFGARIFSFLNLYTRVRVENCNTGMYVAAATNAYPTSNSFRLCFFNSNNIGLQLYGVYHSLINCAFDVNQSALQVYSSRIECIQTSFESNKQALLSHAAYAHYIGCYFLDGDSQWATLEEAENYIVVKNCTVMEDVYLRIKQDEGSVIDRSQLKVLNATYDDSWQTMLTIKGFFEEIGLIKGTAQMVWIEHPIYDGVHRDGLTPKLGANAGVIFYDWLLKKPLWWVGDKWVDATGATV